VTTETAETVETESRRRSSAWTLWAWLMVAVAIVSIAAAVIGGIMAPSVVLDVVSLWPLVVGAFFVAAALLPLRKRGPARISAVLPLLLITMLGSSIVLHLTGWGQLPSASADIVGPRAVGVSEAELTLSLSGRLALRAGAGDLYSVSIERQGGSTGVPEALESLFEDGPTFVVLRETDGGRWFRTSGWQVALGVDPVWSLTLASADLDVDLTSVRVQDLDLQGSGSVVLPPPTATDITVRLDGKMRVEVPPGVSVKVSGTATVPGGWVETVEGHESPFPGPSLLITVVEGSDVEVVAGSN
jgi:hypothetical protein